MLREPATVNDCLLQVESLAYGGDAVGHLKSGKVCFVPGLLPGETAEVAVIQDKKSFARGRIVRLIVPAPERITPECEHFPDCPGCAYIHCDYPTELHWKQRQFADFLLRSGLVSQDQLLAPFASPRRFGCRNKLKLHTIDGKFAMVARDNETLIPIENCRLANPEINEVISRSAAKDVESTVTFRCTENDGVVTFSGKRAPVGSNWLTETVPDVGIFKVPADGFFQTNPEVGTELIRRAVAEIAGSGLPKLAELYCGVGVFSIAAALKNPSLLCVGVELNNAAVKAAKWNASHHGVSGRCRFISGDAGKLTAAAGVDRKSCLLVDPPRSGLSPHAIRNIIEAEPGKIIYISCAPDTLRRDLQIFRDHNWCVEKAGILDMFPGTAHFEAMVTLTK